MDSVKDKLRLWNKSKWEYKNQQMYSKKKKNIWPWFSDELDPDVEEYLDGSKIKAAKILDVGTCSGSQAIALAKKGH